MGMKSTQEQIAYWNKVMAEIIEALEELGEASRKDLAMYIVKKRLGTDKLTVEGAEQFSGVLHDFRYVLLRMDNLSYLDAFREPLKLLPKKNWGVDRSWP